MKAATSEFGRNRTTSDVRSSVATWGKPDMAGQPNSVEIDPTRKSPNHF